MIVCEGVRLKLSQVVEVFTGARHYTLRPVANQVGQQQQRLRATHRIFYFFLFSIQTMHTRPHNAQRGRTKRLGTEGVVEVMTRGRLKW